MLSRPDKETLLVAIARFLEEQVKPGLADPGLAYRSIVAGSVLKSIALECRDETAREERELSRLRELVGNEPPGTPRREAIRLLGRKLCDGIRSRSITGARAHVLLTLRDELAVTNPRFDTRDEVEA